MPSGRVGRKWSGSEDALLGKYTDKWVAERLGLHPTTVCKRRMKLGIPSFEIRQGGRGQITRKLPDDQTLLDEMANLGSMTAIAKKYGVSRQAVSLMLKQINSRNETASLSEKEDNDE